LRGVRLTPSRTHLNAAGRVRLQFSASESATIRIVRSRRQGRRTITTRLIVRHVGAGINSIALAAALRQLHLLKAGRVNLTVSATDASGQRTGGRTLRLTLLR
jgi:hypothetical protein